MDSKYRTRDEVSPATMMRVALCLDGVSRASIIPFGPRIVYRLMFDQKELHGTLWSQITYPLAVTIIAYTIGRALGTRIADILPISRFHHAHSVARLGGVSFALHVFSFGVGLGSVRWLVAIRFFAGTLAGFFCRITNVSDGVDTCESPEQDEEMGQAPRLQGQKSHFIDLSSRTAKVYTTGFAVSMLTGGLLYRLVAASHEFQAMTGGEPFTLTPMFFVFLSFVGELCLRTLFWYTAEKAPISSNYNSFEERGQVRSRQLPMGFDQAPSQTPTEDENEFLDPLNLSTPIRSRSGLPLEQHPRARVNSTVSEASEFFDCQSFGAEEDMEDFDDPAQFTPNTPARRDPFEVAVYKDNKCVYSDGSPAFVPQGYSEVSIPKNYIDFCGGRESKAEKMWENTQRWRREKNVWRIHTAPHPFFSKIKEAYPHFVHGHSKQGYAIIYEQPGRMNLKELFRSGCEISEMVKHYTFFMEFISNHVCARSDLKRLRGEVESSVPSFGTMVVMDVQGISLSSLSGDVVKYLSRAGEINSNYYPFAMKRVFLVNSPFWLAGAWSGIKGIIPDSVQVDILSASRTIDALRQFIDDDQIPKQYGGSSPDDLGEHPYEKLLQSIVDEADKGTEFDGIVEDHPTCSFDHSDRRWVSENNEATPMMADINIASWRTEITLSPVATAPLRRRSISVDRQRSFGSTMSPIEESDAQCPNNDTDSASSRGDILTIVTVMFMVWSAVQGSIECLVPLWILTPPILGGLGYQPSRAGVALFCGTVFVLWIMRTRFARFVAKIPAKAPMRAFRVGVGTEVALFVLIPLIPNSVTSVARCDSVLNMTSTVILLATLAIASMLGRTGAMILHRIASQSFSRDSKESFWLSSVYGHDRLVSDCENGRFTDLVRVAGEVLGILVLAPVYSWSTLTERPTPYDASFCFFLAGVVALSVYVSSFALHLNVVGDFESHPRDKFGDDARRCWSFAGEMIAVPVSDIASLFEEANWSSSRLLGYSRDGLPPQPMLDTMEGKGTTPKKL